MKTNVYDERRGADVPRQIELQEPTAQKAARPRKTGSAAWLIPVGLRLLFGSAMVVSIVLGFAAILRRDVNRHRAWMARGYAIGLGAGTQVLTLTVGEVILGPPAELSRALLMGAAWVINLAVAEWVIRM